MMIINVHCNYFNPSVETSLMTLRTETDPLNSCYASNTCVYLHLAVHECLCVWICIFYVCVCVSVCVCVCQIASWGQEANKAQQKTIQNQNKRTKWNHQILQNKLYRDCDIILITRPLFHNEFSHVFFFSPFPLKRFLLLLLQMATERRREGWRRRRRRRWSRDSEEVSGRAEASSCPNKCSHWFIVREVSRGTGNKRCLSPSPPTICPPPL